MLENEFEIYELLQQDVDVLVSASVDYRIVGSIAMYGEPRFTNDNKILVDLSLQHVDKLCEAFPSPDYYISKEAVKQAIKTRHQFNIMYIHSGYKVDIILSKETEFSRLDISLGKRIINKSVYNAMFASPENVILKKFSIT